MIASFALPGAPGRRSRRSRNRWRWAVQRAIFHLLEEPVPTLADPFPEDDPLPGAYELHLPSDGVTIWYVVAPYRGQEIISIQLVRLDT